jgi:hypothetical protein
MYGRAGIPLLRARVLHVAHIELGTKCAGDPSPQRKIGANRGQFSMRLNIRSARFRWIRSPGWGIRR